MKAIVVTKYGPPDVLELKEVKKPEPLDHQVLVNIRACSVNYGNLVLLRGKPFLARLVFGLLRPKYPIPGGDISGRVEAVGKNVTQFKPGDDVYGDLSRNGWGGFAEYVCVQEDALALKPNNLSFEDAAAVPMAGVTALQALRDKGKIQHGQKVLINGASGGVGTFAVQIAKAFGAEVTGVCSTRNIEILRSIGTDYVINYKHEDFTKNKARYDLILGVNGHHSISEYERVLNPNGTFVHVGGAEAQMFQAMTVGPWISMTSNKKIGIFLQKSNQKDLILLKELIEAGKVRPIIDQKYKLDQISEAFTYFERGHAQGKVIIKVHE